MRFLFITPGCFDKSGISRYNRYQISSLIDLYGERNIRVLSLYGPDQDGLKTDFKVHWHGNGNDIHSKRGLVFQAMKQAFFWRPDFIFTGHVNFSGLGLIASKICRATSILGIYGLEVWGKLSRDASQGLKKTDHVIADCHFTSGYVVQEGYRRKDNVSVIWDCVDLDFFRPRPDQFNYISEKYRLPHRHTSFVILTLGRMSKDAAYKGYERLLEVFRKLAERFPQAILIYAGKGDLIQELKSKAGSYNLNGRVFFTGSVDEEDMASLYSYAHVFSLVSHRDEVSGEGIPLTPLEAMACKVPVIVGNHDGSQEAVFDGKNGVVIDPFDLEKHGEFIEDLILNEDRRSKMAEEAYEIAREYFSYQGFKEKHDQLVKRLRHER